MAPALVMAGLRGSPSVDSAQTALQSHELIEQAVAAGIALSPTLVMMLGEHFTHRTERRGCGFTQATRLLADHVNVLPAGDDMTDFKLFAEASEPKSLSSGSRQARGESMRGAMNALIANCARAESRMFARILRDIIVRDPSPAPQELAPVAPEKLKIGTCPLAEQFFLEIAHDFVRRIGQVNVIHHHGQPLLIEKLGLGDSHSCVSVAPLTINRVEVPVGSLLGVAYDDAKIAAAPSTRSGRGRWIEMTSVNAFRFLRLTTLSVEPVDRKRAFSAHFQQQVAGGLFSPDVTHVDQLVDRAIAERP